MSEKTDQKKIHVYLPVEIQQAVREAAKNEHRSFSGQLAFLLETALKKRKPGQ